MFINIIDRQRLVVFQAIGMPHAVTQRRVTIATPRVYFLLFTFFLRSRPEIIRNRNQDQCHEGEQEVIKCPPFFIVLKLHRHVDQLLHYSVRPTNHHHQLPVTTINRALWDGRVVLAQLFILKIKKPAPFKKIDTNIRINRLKTYT